MKSDSVAMSYHKKTMYVYLFFYFALFLLVVKTGGDEIMTKGEGIYKTIVTAILCLLGTPVIFVFPVGTSFIYLFSYPLCEKENKSSCCLGHVIFCYSSNFCGIIFQ